MIITADFTNIAPTSGVAFAQDGATIAAMGIDFGDYRNEGRPGLFIADFSRRPDHLWRNQGAGLFMEESTPSHVADATFEYLGFGAGFLDYDNDGWLDLFIANGHVYPEVEHSKTGEHYLQTCQLLHNEGNGQFRETTQEAGTGFALRHAGRGVAFGDLFNDGNVDVLVNNNDGPPTLLRNQGTGSKPANHWISLQLIGTRSNRDAIGARVFLTAGGMRQRRDVKSGGSDLSSSDPRLHFGLGGAAPVDSVEVRWPSGLKQAVSRSGLRHLLHAARRRQRAHPPADTRAAGRSKTMKSAPFALLIVFAGLFGTALLAAPSSAMRADPRGRTAAPVHARFPICGPVSGRVCGGGAAVRARTRWAQSPHHSGNDGRRLCVFWISTMTAGRTFSWSAPTKWPCIATTTTAHSPTSRQAAG